MSIATLAKKSRAQRGASARTGWTLATTKSGNCPAPCGGGAPAKQQSFRRLMKNKQQGGGPNPGGTNNNAPGGNCCFTTWKEVNNPKGNKSIGHYLWRKKQKNHNCIYKCVRGQEQYMGPSGEMVIGGSCGNGACDNVGCKCNCNKSMGGTTCCVVHKTMPPLSNGENISWIVKTRTCLQIEKPAPKNPHTC